MAYVLLIDDDPQVRGMLRRMLERMGHVVRVAADGAEGLSCVGECLPDLVVTDILMPRIDGVELIGRLRSRAPSLKVLAISGGGHRLGTQGCLELAEANGASATLPKPFSRTALSRAIEDLLGPST